MFFVLQNFREFSDKNWSEEIGGVGDQIQPKFEQKNLLIKVNFEPIVDTLPKCRGARAVAFDHHRDWSASGQADLNFCVVSTRFTEETLPFCSQGFPSNSTTVTCGDLKAPKKCQVSSSFLRVELMVIHGEFSRHVGTNPRFKWCIGWSSCWSTTHSHPSRWANWPEPQDTEASDGCTTSTVSTAPSSPASSYHPGQVRSHRSSVQNCRTCLQQIGGSIWHEKVGTVLGYHCNLIFLPWKQEMACHRSSQSLHGSLKRHVLWVLVSENYCCIKWQIPFLFVCVCVVRSFNLWPLFPR